MKRENWVDAARGIGILLVIVGHCRRPDILLKLIQAFHMPLFFIISGYLFKIKQNSFSEFAKHKTGLYIKPYIKMAVVNLCIWTAVKYVSGTEDIAKLFLRYIIGLIYSRGTWYWMPNCSALWFLTAIFSANIIMYFIMKRNEKVQILLVGVCLVFAYLFCNLAVFRTPLMTFGDFRFEKIKLIWNIDSAVWGIPFMYLGYLLKKFDFAEKVKSSGKIKTTVCLLVLASLGVCAAYYNHEPFISMDSMIDGNFPLSCAGAVCISLSVFIFTVNFLENSKILTFLGKNTLPILGYNYMINSAVYYFCDKYCDKVQILSSWILQCVLQTVLLFALAYILNVVKNKRKHNEKSY